VTLWSEHGAYGIGPVLPRNAAVETRKLIFIDVFGFTFFLDNWRLMSPAHAGYSVASDT
jgi:hypothetical protein